MQHEPCLSSSDDDDDRDSSSRLCLSQEALSALMEFAIEKGCVLHRDQNKDTEVDVIKNVQLYFDIKDKNESFSVQYEDEFRYVTYLIST